MADPAVVEPTGCEVLVVDDEPTSRFVMRSTLKAEGYHVHEARDGEEALRLLEQHPMDLVLLDIRMPGLSGYEVCRAIRERHSLEELPILFVTGYGSLESLLAGFEAGGNDYLEKPLRLEELVARVKIHLSTLSSVGYRRRLRLAATISREERELRRQLFEVRERERRRLAQELHDGPIQDLYGVVLAMERQPAMREATGQLSQVMADLRSMCSELRPPALVFGDLRSSLEIYLGRLQERHPDVEFRQHLMADGEQLSEWHRLQLFRIGQEALGNALQHAAAGRIDLGFEIDAEGCRLWVHDDGRGFDVPERWIELAREEHFGLIGISERAGAMGASMTLDSAPGRGTRLRVEVPWPQARNEEGEGSVEDSHLDGR